MNSNYIFWLWIFNLAMVGANIVIGIDRQSPVNVIFAVVVLIMSIVYFRGLFDGRREAIEIARESVDMLKEKE